MYKKHPYFLGSSGFGSTFTSGFTSGFVTGFDFFCPICVYNTYDEKKHRSEN
jgi:hypothetical protein